MKKGKNVLFSSLVLLNSATVNTDMVNLETNENTYQVAQVAEISKPIIPQFEVPEYISNPKVFSVSFVPLFTEELKMIIRTELTRENVQFRVDGNDRYGNWFSKHPEVVDVILEASERFTVNPFFLTAIIMQETGNGTSHSLYERNNTSGMRCISFSGQEAFNQHYPEFKGSACSNSDAHGEFAVFSTVKESIMYTAYTLRENYINKGFTTVEAIGQVYAPTEEINDPEGFNKEWIPSVKLRLKNFGIHV